MILSRNIKYLRNKYMLTQEQLANKVNKDRSLIGHWELGTREPTLEDISKLINIFNISADMLISEDLYSYSYDNAKEVSINNNTIKIALYGSITAGIPIEAQNDIIDYIEIPSEWIKKGKTFYALKVSGNSMFPKYLDEDIVIFENVDYYEEANNKDCAVMVNATECTFKRVFINENGITLQPYNTTDFQPAMYTQEQATDFPIRIVGVAVRRITDNL